MSQLLFGGQIQPLQPGLGPQEALVVGDSGRIEGVGSIGEMESLAGLESIDPPRSVGGFERVVRSHLNRLA